MVPAALAFTGALVYGSADFLGGLAARRLRAVIVTSISAASGMALIVVLVALVPFAGGMPTRADVAWGALSGVAAAIAISLLYGCLALGPMSILSPVTAVVSALAPVVWDAATGGEALGPWALGGLALALVAIVLVAFVPGDALAGQALARPSLRALAMAVGAGLGIGAFVVILDQISPDAGLAPLAVGRALSAVVTGAVAVAVVVAAVRAGRTAPDAVRQSAGSDAATGRGAGDAAAALRAPLRTAIILAVACGVADATANALLFAALRAGESLSVAAALTALYPAGTVILAAVVLRERLAPAQWLGLALALASGVLLAVG